MNKKSQRPTTANLQHRLISLSVGRTCRHLVAGLTCSALFVSGAVAEDEVQKLTKRLLAPPKITTEAGFAAKFILGPGRLYDPLWIIPRGDEVWLNDDGGEENEKGSRLLAINAKGKIRELAGLGKLLPAGKRELPDGFIVELRSVKN